MAIEDIVIQNHDVQIKQKLTVEGGLDVSDGGITSGEDNVWINQDTHIDGNLTFQTGSTGNVKNATIEADQLTLKTTSNGLQLDTPSVAFKNGASSRDGKISANKLTIKCGSFKVTADEDYASESIIDYDDGANKKELMIPSSRVKRTNVSRFDTYVQSNKNYIKVYTGTNNNQPIATLIDKHVVNIIPLEDANIRFKFYSASNISTPESYTVKYTISKTNYNGNQSTYFYAEHSSVNDTVKVLTSTLMPPTLENPSNLTESTIYAYNQGSFTIKCGTGYSSSFRIEIYLISGAVLVQQ